ncbi:unnamed protein product [Fusarium graminearum]|nr:unnamed protein product [Fusarium graminearum]CAG1968206.1 unnamed protein product [Fusarium graminearum]VTO82235.1 unnamed protein product [Fusarium graminearum]
MIQSTISWYPAVNARCSVQIPDYTPDLDGDGTSRGVPPVVLGGDLRDAEVGLEGSSRRARESSRAD